MSCPPVLLQRAEALEQHKLAPAPEKQPARPLKVRLLILL